MNIFILQKDQDRANVIAFIKEISLVLPKEVTIGNFDPKRSNQANSLAHVYADIMGRDLGYGVEEMYELLKGKFLGVEQFEFMGLTITRAKQSRKLSKSQYNEFLNKIIELASNLGIQLPIANEASYE